MQTPVQALYILCPQRSNLVRQGEPYEPNRICFDSVACDADRVAVSFFPSGCIRADISSAFTISLAIHAARFKVRAVHQVPRPCGVRRQLDLPKDRVICQGEQKNWNYK